MLLELAPINNKYINREAKSATLSIQASNQAILFVTPVMLVFDSAKELNRKANFIIKNLEAKTLEFGLNTGEYTKMYSQGDPTPQNSIRAYFTKDVKFDADFWIDRLVADNANFFMKQNANGIYTFKVDYNGYNVKNLSTTFWCNVIWEMYNVPSAGGSCSNSDSSARLVLEKELEKINQKEKEKTPEIKHLAKDIQKKISSSKKGRLTGDNFINSLMKKFNINGGFGTVDRNNTIFGELMGMADFALVVTRNGLSYIIIADDPSVRTMLGAVRTRSVLQNLFNSIMKEMRLPQIIGIIKNFLTNLIRLFIPSYGTN